MSVSLRGKQPVTCGILMLTGGELWTALRDQENELTHAEPSMSQTSHIIAVSPMGGVWQHE